MSKKSRSTQARRYVIIQDEGAKKAKSVGEPKVIEKPFDLDGTYGSAVAAPFQAAGTYQSMQEGALEKTKDYSEAQINHADTTLMGVETMTLKTGAVINNFAGSSHRAGDINISGTGKPDATYDASPQAPVPLPTSADPSAPTYIRPPFLPTVARNTEIAGEGFISEGGSADTARFTFKKEGQTQFQYRATPNYVGRVPNALAKSNGTDNLGRSYFRPGFLSLKNGNLLSFYIDGVSPPYNWFRHGLYTMPGGVSSITSGGSFVFSGPGANNYSKKGFVKMHLLDKATMLWSAAPEYEIYAPYSPDATDISGTGALAPQNVYQVSCHDAVQFDDTEEVLYLYAGFFGSMEANAVYANGFFTVDAIRSPLTTADGFVDGETGLVMGSGGPKTVPTTNRAFCQFRQGQTAQTNTPGDVAGVTVSTIVLDMTAQVLPSGRVVCVIATQTQMISMVSDDRGKSWRGRRVLDLTFGDLDLEGVTIDGTSATEMKQRYASLSSCLDRNGQMVVLLTGNPTGSRAKSVWRNEDTLAADIEKGKYMPEPVISLFVTGDGESFGSEKKLATGQFTRGFNDGIGVGNGPSDTSMERYKYGSLWTNMNQIDEAVYALAGSVCMTPTGFIHVQVTSLNLGGLCGAHAQWVMTRTLSSRDIAAGDTGQEIARSISDQIQSGVSPVHSRTHRLVPAIVQYSTNNNQNISSLTEWPPTIQSWANFFAFPGMLKTKWAGGHGGGQTITVPSLVSPALNEYSPNGWTAQAAMHRLGNPMKPLAGERYQGIALVNGVERPQGLDQDPNVTSPSSSWTAYNLGGGPIWCNGPMDIESVLWRGQIMTSICYKYEETPGDYPGSYLLDRHLENHYSPECDEYTPAQQYYLPCAHLPAAAQTYERSVIVLQSGHFQPANVRIPTQIEIGAPLLQCAREYLYEEGGVDQTLSGHMGTPATRNSIQGFLSNGVEQGRYIGGTGETVDVGYYQDRVAAVSSGGTLVSSSSGFRMVKLGNTFGGNAWSLSWFAGVTPIQQGWSMVYGYNPTDNLSTIAGTAGMQRDAYDRTDETDKYRSRYICGAQQTLATEDGTMNKYVVVVVGATLPFQVGDIINQAQEVDLVADGGQATRINNAAYYQFPAAYKTGDANDPPGAHFDSYSVFPNSEGVAVKTEADSDRLAVSNNYNGTLYDAASNPSQHYATGRLNAYTFVCRTVVCIDYAAKTDYASGTTYKEPSAGVSVLLIDTSTESPTHVKMALHMYKNPGAGALARRRHFFLTNDGVEVSGSDIYVEVEDTQQPSGNYPQSGDTSDYRSGWIEVLWGLREDGEGLTSNLQPFLMARPWNRASDPDFLDDFIVADLRNVAYVTPASGTQWTPADGTPGTGREFVRFGAISPVGIGDSWDNRRCFWKSVQMSRGFLASEGCFAEVNSGSVENFPIGNDITGHGRTIQESLHTINDPAMGMFQVNDAGCMSPMRPSLATDNPPQFLDRGVGIAMRGRATTNQTFTYEAKSRHEPESIFSLPTSYGWRGSDTRVAAALSDPQTTRYHTPETELVFDFGSDGVTPNAISMFGVNSPAVAIQFTNTEKVDEHNKAIDGSPDFISRLDGTNKAPSFLIAPPGDGYIKMGVWAERAPSSWYSAGEAAARCMFINRYLYYAQNATPSGSLNQTIDPGQIRFSILSGGYVSFSGSPGYPSQDANAITRAPFTPHQFKSVEGASFYLVLYGRPGGTASGQTWMGGDASGGWNYSAEGIFDRGQGGRNRFVFKIEDNGADWVKLTAGGKGLEDFYEGSSSYSLRRIRAAAIISDRFAFNLPDKALAADWTSEDVAGNSGPGPESVGYTLKYRYMKIRLGGCEYFDPAEQYHKIGYMTIGRRLDLSNRDFEWGWSMGLEGGRTMTTLQTGQRRSIRNHRPRQSWTVSYSPKPEKKIEGQGGFANPLKSGENPRTNSGYTDDGNMNIETAIAGYGPTHTQSTASVLSAFPAPSESSQFSFRSKTTWQEIVDRVTTMGIQGDVFTLGFEAYDMTFYTGLIKLASMRAWNSNPPSILKAHACLTEPKKLVAARCTSYGGAKHMGYQGALRTSDLYGGNIDGSDGGSQLETSNIIQVESIKFEEEL